MVRGQIVTVANTKGGVGKSTIAGNLAWTLTVPEFKRRVLLVDADHQASVTKWFDLAEDVPFDRMQLTTARVLQQQLQRLRERYEIIVVDCPPMQSDVTAAALYQADLGLIPVQPSPLDVLAYGELVPLLRQAQGIRPELQLRFVVNQLAPRTVLAREVEESLRDAEIPRLAAQLHSRQVYRQVVARGSSVVLDSGPARGEILSLAHEVLDALQTRP
jgi:chromosome partitioning protein